MLRRRVAALLCAAVWLASAVPVSADSIFSQLAVGALSKSLSKSILDNRPIIVDERSALPAAGFDGAGFHVLGAPRDVLSALATSRDGSVALAPGDYTFFVQTYCMRRSATSPAAHRYTLARLGGRRAELISRMNARAASARIPHGELQATSWSLQAGLRYTELAAPQRAVVDTLVPDYRDLLAKSYVEQIQDVWNTVARVAPSIPSFDQTIDRLGDAGRMYRQYQSFRADVIARGDNPRALNNSLIAASPATPRAPPAPTADTPWSAVGDHVYGRMVTTGGAGSVAALEIRVANEPQVVPITSLVADPGDSNVQPLSFTPVVDPSEVFGLLKGAYNFLIGDDLRVALGENSTPAERALAIGGIAVGFTPIGRGLKIFAKAGKLLHETEVITRYGTEAEVAAMRETGLLRGGKTDNAHFVTNDVYDSAAEAKQKLALYANPTHRIDVVVEKGLFPPSTPVKQILGPDGKVVIHDGVPLSGGGTERVLKPVAVPAISYRVTPLKP